MGECPVAVALENCSSLEAGDRPQAPPGADQLMDLEEGGKEDCAEADQTQLQGLLAQLQRLSPSFQENSPCSEDSLAPASDGEEGRAFEEERGPLLRPTSQADCQGLLGECAPCPLHLAMRHTLAVASRRFLQPSRGWRGQGSHGLLSTEADREDLLSLLHFEEGPPVEQSEQMPLAHSDVVVGRRCQGAQGEEGSASALERPAWSEMPPDPALQSLEQQETEGPRQSFGRGAVDQEDPGALDSSLGASSQKSIPGPRWRAAAEGSGRGGEPPPPPIDGAVSILPGLSVGSQTSSHWCWPSTGHEISGPLPRGAYSHPGEEVGKNPCLSQ